MFILPAIILALVALVNLASAGSLPSEITWTNPDLINKIQIEKGPSFVGPFVTINQVMAGQTLYTDATNEPGETACYRLAYVNASGIGPYAGPVCKTFPALPLQTPEMLTVK